jgi:hypothetical protein
MLEFAAFDGRDADDDDDGAVLLIDLLCEFDSAADDGGGNFPAAINLFLRIPSNASSTLTLSLLLDVNGTKSIGTDDPFFPDDINDDLDEPLIPLLDTPALDQAEPAVLVARVPSCSDLLASRDFDSGLLLLMLLLPLLVEMLGEV